MTNQSEEHLQVINPSSSSSSSNLDLATNPDLTLTSPSCLSVATSTSPAGSILVPSTRPSDSSTTLLIPTNNTTTTTTKTTKTKTEYPSVDSGSAPESLHPATPKCLKNRQEASSTSNFCKNHHHHHQHRHHHREECPCHPSLPRWVERWNRHWTPMTILWVAVCLTSLLSGLILVPLPPLGEAQGTFSPGSDASSPSKGCEGVQPGVGGGKALDRREILHSGERDCQDQDGVKGVVWEPPPGLASLSSPPLSRVQRRQQQTSEANNPASQIDTRRSAMGSSTSRKGGGGGPSGQACASFLSLFVLLFLPLPAYLDLLADWYYFYDEDEDDDQREKDGGICPCRENSVGNV